MFVIPWTAVRQASLSSNNTRSLLKLMSIMSVMPSNNLITLWQIEGEKVEAVTDFLYLGSKITVMVTQSVQLLSHV